MDQDELAALERVLEEDEHSLVFARLASAYLEQGDLGKAKTLCSRGAETHPLYVNGYLVLAKCHRAEGAAKEARIALKRALRLDPGNMPALWELAQMNAAEGRSTLAARNLTRILQLEPLNDAVRDELARFEKTATPRAAEEAEPFVPEEVLPDQFLDRAEVEEPQPVGILPTMDGEQTPAAEEEPEDRGSGWDLLEQVQEDVAQEMGDEEEGLTSVDEIAGFLEQDQPLAAEGPEDVEDGQPTRSDLSGLLFADDEERADQEEGREKMRAAPSGAEGTEPSVVEDLGLPGLSTAFEADHEDVTADEQDTEQAQLPGMPSTEAEGGMESAQSSLDELLSSLESEYGGEASSESVSEELEDLLSEAPEESDVPPESISPVEAASESTLESDELLRILGEVADQEETEPPDVETISAAEKGEGGMESAQSSLDELLSSLESEYGGEASSESVSEELEDLLSEAPEESDVPPESISPVEAASESTLESDELLRILGEVADQEETEPPDAEAAADEEDMDDPIVTVTLAEIYANQGLVEKAIQILEEALRQRPDDLRIRNRLQEIRDRADDGSRMDSSTEEE